MTPLYHITDIRLCFLDIITSFTIRICSLNCLLELLWFASTTQADLTGHVHCIFQAEALNLHSDSVGNAVAMFVYSTTKNGMSQRITGCIYFPATINKWMRTLRCINGVKHYIQVSTGWIFIPAGTSKPLTVNLCCWSSTERAPIATVGENIIHSPSYQGRAFHQQQSAETRHGHESASFMAIRPWRKSVPFSGSGWWTIPL